MRGFLTTIVALMLLTIATPGAVAATYQNTSTVTPVYTTPNASSGERYDLSLEAGDTVDITVTWQDPNTDFDVMLIEPGGSCEILPNPDAPCLADSAVGIGEAATCANGPSQGANAGLGPGTETVSATASVTGQHEVWVVVSTGIPLQPVDYSVTVDVNNGDGATLVDDPQALNALRSSGHCGVVDALTP